MIIILGPTAIGKTSLATKLAFKCNGEIISAVVLTEEQSLNLDRMISRIVGVPVKFRTTIDPEIIGGIVATIGDRRIDGSVSTTFKEMRRVVVG